MADFTKGIITVTLLQLEHALENGKINEGKYLEACTMLGIVYKHEDEIMQLKEKHDDEILQLISLRRKEIVGASRVIQIQQIGLMFIGFGLVMLRDWINQCK